MSVLGSREAHAPPSIAKCHPVAVSATAMRRDRALAPTSEPSGTALCCASDRHSLFLLWACFSHCFPCWRGFFFLLPPFSCPFFPLSCSHTHAQSIVYFSSCPFCLSPSRFSLFLFYISSNPLPWKSGRGSRVGCVW